eukprot:Plantae.Rhodophyta-Purpureofilum_apyrenoidigerum.ctg13227.p1 GENE.Plantae.Rhodophyta-Purpureofilum_apyrenoidigerum.ctg13227~~Plantae.Rhodophyta-Purpureofilum_apyrenoidigerum.ctg13227.p1  ORF type:complete len:230 (+),score=31.83 Plantae.Rhodophyta-Purpureofilum_apyrenoidigerum.ctg13227:158-847(+)
MPVFLSITALLGKADATFRYVGGSAIVFNFLRTYVFGKVLRTVEYPDGDLSSIKMHRSNLERLKTVIAKAQPPIFPTAYLSSKDVKQVVLWTPPHFTERIICDSDVYNIPDGSWLLWSKFSESDRPIPRRGVKLEGSSQPIPKKSVTEEQSDLFSLARRFRRENRLDQVPYNALVNLIAEEDRAVFALHRYFSEDDDEIRRHILELLRQRGVLKSVPRTDAVSTDKFKP